MRTYPHGAFLLYALAVSTSSDRNAHACLSFPHASAVLMRSIVVICEALGGHCGHQDGASCAAFPSGFPEACADYKQLPMLQASWSLWRNDARSRRFLRIWHDLVLEERLMSLVPFHD